MQVSELGLTFMTWVFGIDQNAPLCKACRISTQALAMYSVPGCSVLKKSTGQGFRILDPQSSHTVVCDLGYHSLIDEATGSRKRE